MKKIVALILFLFFQTSSGLAQPKSSLGGLPGAPMRVGFGSIGMSSGNAVSAVKNEMIAGYYNPALTPYQKDPFAMLSFGLLSFDRMLNFVSYSQSLPPSAGLSIGIINTGVRNIDGRDRDGRKTKTYSTSENAFLLSFGIRISDDISIGLTPKIFYYSLFDGISSTTVGFDAGALFNLSDQWTIAAVVQEIGSKYIWDTSNLYGARGNTTREQFPLRKRLGIGYSGKNNSFRVSGELEQIGTVLLLRVGGSLRITDVFSVSSGVDQITWYDDILPKPTLGFSLSRTFGTLHPSLIYAFVFEPYSQTGIHIISIALHFR